MKKATIFLPLAFVCASLVWAMTASAAALTVRVATREGEGGSTVQLPIEVAGAAKVGALQFDLVYDPQVVQADTVTRGALGGNALLDFNSSVPGRLRVGIVTTDGLQGDGVLANVNFKITGRAGANSALTVENARAWETPSHLEVLVNSEAGRVSVTAGSPGWMVLGGGAAFAVLLLLLLLFALSRRRKPTPVSAPATYPAQPPARPTTLPESQAKAGWVCPRCRTVNSPTTRFCGMCGAART